MILAFGLHMMTGDEDMYTNRTIVPKATLLLDLILAQTSELAKSTSSNVTDIQTPDVVLSSYDERIRACCYFQAFVSDFRSARGYSRIVAHPMRLLVGSLVYDRVPCRHQCLSKVSIKSGSGTAVIDEEDWCRPTQVLDRTRVHALPRYKS